MIQFGLFTPQLGPYELVLSRAQAAEAAGFDSVWLIDHLWAPGAPREDALEAWTTATAIAVATERVRIGHMVLCASFRHPALLAKMAATLDVISGGRVELGLGWGSVAEEMQAFGLGDEPPAVRAARLEETILVLRKLFTGEPVTYEGQYYQLRDAVARPRPVQEALPIHVGGAGPKLTMPIVARHADVWNCVSYGVARLAELIPLAGKARISVQHPIGLVMDESERERVVARAQRRFGSWGGLIAGNAEEIAEALRAEVKLGAELFIVQLDDFGTPESIAHFAREVIPRVRA
jgi:alkanesulfonate monooxygenase SsuD/methylene tetrahydromethanopterin reductase-like flavin-dependent oxidoreductase (luciferase family)